MDATAEDATALDTTAEVYKKVGRYGGITCFFKRVDATAVLISFFATSMFLTVHYFDFILSLINYEVCDFIYQYSNTCL